MHHAASLAPVCYARRRPETTSLYRLVADHLATFLATMDSAERSLPRYVTAELSRYLDCGILARGFARVLCGECGHTRLVAFSCKSRSFCPSCLGRTMNETAAHLVDHVVGEVPVRHWVLSLPPPLRYLVAHDAALCSAVLEAFLHAVFDHLRGVAKRELGLRSLRDAHPGAVTVIQRASSHLALNPHLHSVVTDGVYVHDVTRTRPVFRALPPPCDAEVAAVAWRACERVCKVLRKRGLWLDVDPSEDPLAQREPGLAACAAASVQGVLLLGERAGKRLMRLYGEAARAKKPAGSDAEQNAPPTTHLVPGYGFSLDAHTRIAARDKAGRERLLRYALRPPLAQDRLVVMPNGHARLTLKRPWSDGTTSVVFEPLDFLSKLAALVPPPRTHRTRYHGVWSSHAKLRSLVRPERDDDGVEPGHAHGGRRVASDGDQNGRAGRRGWALLLARVFAIDVLACPRCKAGRMQRVAFITQPRVIRAILESVGMAADAPVVAPSRLGLQLELGCEA